jgi:hypothetical protein
MLPWTGFNLQISQITPIAPISERCQTCRVYFPAARLNIEFLPFKIPPGLPLESSLAIFVNDTKKYVKYKDFSFKLWQIETITATVASRSPYF